MSFELLASPAWAPFIRWTQSGLVQVLGLAEIERKPTREGEKSANSVPFDGLLEAARLTGASHPIVSARSPFTLIWTSLGAPD